jgi:phosphohistidine phosphatase
MTGGIRTLLLWRHAKSAWDDPSLSDLKRPLAPRGIKAGRVAAHWLSEHWEPDAVRCSPATRTIQTWQYLAPLLDPEPCIIYDLRIYEAPWSALLTVVRETADDIGTLLLIGHNPGFADLTAALSGPLDRKFPTGACAILQTRSDWRELAPGGAELVRLVTPKMLRGTKA